MKKYLLISLFLLSGCQEVEEKYDEVDITYDISGYLSEYRLNYYKNVTKGVIRIAENTWNISLEPVEVYFSIKPLNSSCLGRVGSAYMHRNIITYNPKFFACETVPEAFKIRTIVHEVAHLVTYSIIGTEEHHNENWQGIYSELLNNVDNHTL